MRAAFIAMFVGFSVLPVTEPQAPVEIDRTLERVYGTPVMASDVRQARLLRLLPESRADDATIQTALENRLLILREVSRVTIADPTPAAISSRRTAWAAVWANAGELTTLMTRTGMNDQALSGWFRDELRIAAYMDQRFGLSQDENRARHVAEWIADLRRRANLSGRDS